MPPCNGVGTVNDDQKLHFHRESEARAVTIKHTLFQSGFKPSPNCAASQVYLAESSRSCRCALTQRLHAPKFSAIEEFIVFWRMTMSCCARVCGVCWKMNRISKWWPRE